MSGHEEIVTAIMMNIDGHSTSDDAYRIHDRVIEPLLAALRDEITDRANVEADLRAQLAEAERRVEKADVETMPLRQRDAYVAAVLQFMRDRGYVFTMPPVEWGIDDLTEEESSRFLAALAELRPPKDEP
jgi:hypothetical protein